MELTFPKISQYLLTDYDSERPSEDENKKGVEIKKGIAVAVMSLSFQLLLQGTARP
jgi:hypothetical protein